MINSQPFMESSREVIFKFEEISVMNISKFILGLFGVIHIWVISESDSLLIELAFLGFGFGWGGGGRSIDGGR